MAAFRILSAGYDHELIQSRSLLLRQAGFVVDEAYSPLGILGLVKSASVDAVVICHTIPGNEQRWLISSVRKVHRPCQLSVSRPAFYDASQEDCLIAANEPVDLLAVLRKAIQPRVMGSSGTA